MKSSTSKGIRFFQRIFFSMLAVYMLEVIWGREDPWNFFSTVVLFLVVGKPLFSNGGTLSRREPHFLGAIFLFMEKFLLYFVVLRIRI